MVKVWTDDFVSVVCDYLKERRTELGHTIYQVAQASGVSWQSVSAYEKHTRRPTLDCLAKVALALELRPSELLARAEQKLGLPGGIKAPGKSLPVNPKSPKGVARRRNKRT